MQSAVAVLVLILCCMASAIHNMATHHLESDYPADWPAKCRRAFDMWNEAGNIVMTPAFLDVLCEEACTRPLDCHKYRGIAVYFEYLCVKQNNEYCAIMVLNMTHCGNCKEV